MALLQEASLIVTANAQKAGKLYSIIPQSGAGDFDVTRATSATRVDSQGLIEIPRTNLFLRSEEFENATWSRQNIANIISNTSLSPINTLTADKIIPDTTSNQHRIVQFANFTGQGVLSVYAKADGYNFLSLGYGGGVSGGTIVFNLSNGTISGTAVGIVTSIENVGNGWYRCSIYRNDLGGGISVSYWIIVRNDNTTNNYIGDGTSGVLVWGAQLETSVSPTTYIPTTSVARTRFQGITQDGLTASNIPRLDYTNASCPSILIEQQRTNSLTWSDDFNNVIWVKTNVSINENVSASPTGMSSADRMTGNGVSGEHRLVFFNNSFTSGTTYTLSFFVKKDTNDFVQLTLGGSAFTSLPFANYDINSGILGTNGGGATSTISSIGNGWYRCAITVIASTTVLDFATINLVTSSSAARRESNTLSTSVFIWGAQLEVGSNATSYIPTLSTSMTRNADVITNTNASTLIGQTEGSMYVEFNNTPYVTANGTFRWLLCIRDPSTNNFLKIFRNTSVIIFNRVGMEFHNGTFVLNLFSSSNTYDMPLGRNKVLVTYQNGLYKLFQNGALRATVSNSLTVPTNMSRIDVGSFVENVFANLNDGVYTAALWKTVLTDSQAIQLTTL